MVGFSLITALLISSDVEQSLPQPTNFRVATVAYEDFHAEVEHFEHLFVELSQRDPESSDLADQALALASSRVLLENQSLLDAG